MGLDFTNIVAHIPNMSSPMDDLGSGGETRVMVIHGRLLDFYGQHQVQIGSSGNQFRFSVQGLRCPDLPSSSADLPAPAAPRNPRAARERGGEKRRSRNSSGDGVATRNSSHQNLRQKPSKQVVFLVRGTHA